MKTMNAPPKPAEYISPATTGSYIGSWSIALVTCVVLFMLGGVSTSWAGNQKVSTPSAPPLHLTGFSIHVGPGGFHIGVGGHHHRHGHLKGRGFNSWNKRGWNRGWNKGGLYKRGGKPWRKLYKGRRSQFDNRKGLSFDRWGKRGGKHWGKFYKGKRSPYDKRKGRVFDRWGKRGGKYWGKKFNNRRNAFNFSGKLHHHHHGGQGRHHHHKGRW